MRVLILGVNGFIGSSLAHRLAAKGHEVIGASRRASPTPSVLSRHIHLDLATADETTWTPALTGVDAIVNCAGLMQGGPADRLSAVHVDAVRVLTAACERAGLRRVVHLSAVGVDRGQNTEFAATKWAGDQVLMASVLDWVILRPSIVLGRPAYGGSALIRGLAALNVLPSVGRTRPSQVVQLDDLLDTIEFFLPSTAPARIALDLVGPRAWPFNALVKQYRSWLGWREAADLPLPGWLSRLFFRLGDLAGRLGWRPPIRTTARLEIEQLIEGDAGPWTRLTGIVPRDLAKSLAAEPASVQERWFARLYLLKALLIAVIALFWIATGVVALGPGWEYGMGLMAEGGVHGGWAALVIIGGALCDIVVGALIAWRPTSRAGLYAAIGVTVLYSVIGTVLVPRLWLDPMGPLLKVPPILVLHLAALAVIDDR